MPADFSEDFVCLVHGIGFLGSAVGSEIMIPVVNAEQSLSSPVGISCLCGKRISTLEFQLLL